MRASLIFLPGDGIGPEVLVAARRVLSAVGAAFRHDFEFHEGLIGGAALDATGEPLPAATLEAAAGSDAVLLGAVGGPQWSDPSASVRPEQGLLRLRQHFELFANLRPVRILPGLEEHAPLRPDLLQGVDILFVRELTGGIYFGPRQEADASGVAFDTMLYKEHEIERIAHVAFRAARGRRRRVTSVDKANVLASMRLWRRTVERVAGEYPEVELEHQLVDACAMDLLRRPSRFDVVLTGNMFGDILTDEAATLAGSLGLLPSASLAEGRFGLYEPVHGSAPDIVGQDRANPVGAILSAAMLLRHSLNLEAEARSVEGAVAGALASGLRTADLCRPGEKACSTTELTDAVVENLQPR